MIAPNPLVRPTRGHTNPHRPPGPRGFATIGSLIDYGRKPLEFSTQCAETYGDAAYLSII
ncbi:MAG: hypothetical protein F6K19_19610 [Cyanothece sp. SIO1E1]|nr:hypothetical protein [Cyanothece sp. SIO1E1]